NGFTIGPGTAARDAGGSVFAVGNVLVTASSRTTPGPPVRVQQSMSPPRAPRNPPPVMVLATRRIAPPEPAPDMVAQPPLDDPDALPPSATRAASMRMVPFAAMRIAPAPPPPPPPAQLSASLNDAPPPPPLPPTRGSSSFRPKNVPSPPRVGPLDRPAAPPAGPRPAPPSLAPFVCL